MTRAEALIALALVAPQLTEIQSARGVARIRRGLRVLKAVK